MRSIEPALESYAERHAGAERPYLAQLAVETRANVDMPEMLSGHLQGRFLSMLGHLVKPVVAVEVGTFTGYGALCIAEGLAEKGMLHTIDIDTRNAELVARYIKLSGMGGRITCHHGAALDIIPTLPTPFDLVFIDADKPNYPNYYDAVIDRVRPGGLIIADNVLWSGRVLRPEREQDEATRAIHTFNAKVANDARVEPVLVPLRDGLMLARRK